MSLYAECPKCDTPTPWRYGDWAAGGKHVCTGCGATLEGTIDSFGLAGDESIPVLEVKVVES